MEGPVKKQRSNVGGDESCWDGLSSELLALIFSRLPSDEMARAVPFVCRSWLEATFDSLSWSDIDVEQWCRRVNNPEAIEYALRKLFRRSSGTLRRLCAYKITDSVFSALAASGQCLKVLQIPVSSVTDCTVLKHAGLLSNVTVLDLSYCVGISWIGLQALGVHCKSLVELKRNMPPPEFEYNGEEAEENEAMVVADTMPVLLRLELAYGLFSDKGLEAILEKCKSLCHLDIRGCWNVSLGGNLEEKSQRIDWFLSPWEDEIDDAIYAEDDFNGN